LSVGHCPFDVRQLPIAGASKRQMQHHDTTAATATATEAQQQHRREQHGEQVAVAT